MYIDLPTIRVHNDELVEEEDENEGYDLKIFSADGRKVS